MFQVAVQDDILCSIVRGFLDLFGITPLVLSYLHASSPSQLSKSTFQFQRALYLISQFQRALYLIGRELQSLDFLLGTPVMLD